MQLRRRFKTTGIILLFGAAVALAGNTLYYINFDSSFGFLRHKQNAVATGWYLPAFYAHIFAGALVLIAGFFQFQNKLRKRFPATHRLTGYMYVIGILAFAAPGGMVMAMFIGRGPVVLSSFVLQCTLWIVFTVLALLSARQRNFRMHEQWMIRSFALTLAAITLRMYIFGASWFYDLSAPAVYGVFAWLSWVPNLILGEIIIRRKITSRRMQNSVTDPLIAR